MLAGAADRQPGSDAGPGPDRLALDVPVARPGHVDVAGAHLGAAALRPGARCLPARPAPAAGRCPADLRCLRTGLPVAADRPGALQGTGTRDGREEEVTHRR